MIYWSLFEWHIADRQPCSDHNTCGQNMHDGLWWTTELKWWKFKETTPRIINCKGLQKYKNYKRSVITTKCYFTVSFQTKTRSPSNITAHHFLSPHLKWPARIVPRRTGQRQLQGHLGPALLHQGHGGQLLKAAHHTLEEVLEECGARRHQHFGGDVLWAPQGPPFSVVGV